MTLNESISATLQTIQPTLKDHAVVITGSPKHEIVFGPQPQTLICAYCRQIVTTVVEPTVTPKTHLFALILCLFGCCLCCGCICPYCMDSCQGRNHYCSKCKALLGCYHN